VKIWLTSAELAALQLPGLPSSKRSVNALADRERWAETRHARSRAGRGGGLEYRIDLLPLEARLAYMARCGVAAPAEISEAAADQIAAAPDSSAVPSASAERDARLAILAAYDTFQRASQLSKTTGVHLFCDLYNSGGCSLPDYAARIKRVSPRSLVRWLSARQSGDIDMLAVDRGAARRGQGLLDAAEGGALRATAIGLIAHQPHLSADHVRTILIDKFGSAITHQGRAVPMPSVRTLQARLQFWREEHAAELLAITNPDAHKSRARVTGARAHLVTRLNEMWQIDASPVDALCVDGRHTVYVCIDVYSRRIITHVSRTPRADAVALLLRKTLTAWGVPELIKTDNGSDFVARASVRLLSSLGIEVQRSDPYSPEQKGVVERAIGTMQRDLVALLPGFIGHNVTDRRRIEQRRSFAARLGIDDGRAFAVELSGEQLQRDLDAWSTDRYAHRPHGGLSGATPFSVAAAWSLPVRRIQDEAALALLLAPVAGQDGRRTVQKRGIRIEGSYYIAPEILPGETVFVRMDPADMGRAWVFDAEGEKFRGVAICPELAGVDPAAAVMEARAAQRRLIEERTAPIRAEARKIKPRDMVEAVARQAAKQAGKLVELPRRSDSYSTPALTAAADGVRGRKAPTAQPLRPADAALMAGIEADLAAHASVPAAPTNVRKLRTSETPQRRFRRCLDLEAALARGEDIATADAIWLGSYRESSECRTQRGIYAEFGEEALR
jgi:putative transposase